MLSSIERYAGTYIITGMGQVCLNDHERKQNTTVKMVDTCMSVDFFRCPGNVDTAGGKRFQWLNGVV